MKSYSKLDYFRVSDLLKISKLAAKLAKEKALLNATWLLSNGKYFFKNIYFNSGMCSLDYEQKGCEIKC